MATCFSSGDGILLTPPSSDGALEGITREAVLSIAKELGVRAEEASIGTYDLRAAEEAFLVGTGAGLVAIRTVDGRDVVSCPGPIFERIRAAFMALVHDETRCA